MKLKIFNTIASFNEENESDVGIVIGNFDGVHLGHQKLLKSLMNSCEEKELVPVVITFRPHPLLFFKPELNNFLLNSYEEKKSLIASYGIKNLIELDFNKDLQRQDAKEFLESSLLQITNLRVVYLGHDFSLGSGKVPAKKILLELVASKSIDIQELDTFKSNQATLSSTLIRNKLKNQPIEEVNKYLGYHYFISSTVINGYGVGKKELVPTANIKLDSKRVYPKAGVYFTKTIADDKEYYSITNIGVRPSLKDEGGLSIETNIFDFNDDLYDSNITVMFLKFHRDEMKFNSKEELLSQIQEDIKAARKFHA